METPGNEIRLLEVRYGKALTVGNHCPGVDLADNLHSIVQKRNPINKNKQEGCAGDEVSTKQLFS